jgi:hypothetical protein
MITRDHHQHTEFLKHCLRYGENAKCQELRREITRLQGDAFCVRRAAWLMVVLIALALAGLAYATILPDHFPYPEPQLIQSFLCALGGGSLISFLAFTVLGMVYRRKLDLRREECRQMVATLLESRLGNPPAAPRLESPLGDAVRGPVPDTDGANVSPVPNPNLNPDWTPSQ